MILPASLLDFLRHILLIKNNNIIPSALPLFDRDGLSRAQTLRVFVGEKKTYTRVNCIVKEASNQWNYLFRLVIFSS